MGCRTAQKIVFVFVLGAATRPGELLEWQQARFRVGGFWLQTSDYG
jgi:hypothetical protein